MAGPSLARPVGDEAATAAVRTTGERQAWAIRTEDGVVTIPIDPVLSLSSLIMVRDAVRAGVGAGRLPISLVSQDLADGTLVQWGEVDAPYIALWTAKGSARPVNSKADVISVVSCEQHRFKKSPGASTVTAR